MKKRLIIVGLLSGLLYVSTTMAQNETKKTFSLKQAQEYAVKEAYAVKSAEYDLEMSKKKVKEIVTIGLPQVSGDASLQDFLNIPVQVMPNFLSPAVTGVLVANGILPPSAMDQPANPAYIEAKFGTKYSTKLGVTASQLLFDGSYVVGVQASKIFVAMSTKSLEKSEIETRENVAQTYYLVLVVKENEKILETSLSNLTKTLGETTQIQKNGFLEETDVDQLQLLVSNLTNTVNKIKRQSEVAMSLLKMQMGIKLEENIELTDSLNGILLQTSAEDLLSKELDVKKHIDYQIISTTETLKQLNLRKERYGYIPSMAAFYTYSKTASASELTLDKWYPTSLLGVSLKVPIFDSGQKMFKIQQAKLDVLKTQNLQNQVEQGLKLEVISQKSNYNNALDSFKKEEENMVLAKKIYDRTLIKYNEGIVGSMDLTQAHNQYLTSQTSYFTAVFELLNTKSKLNKALNNY